MGVCHVFVIGPVGGNGFQEVQYIFISLHVQSIQ